MPPDLASIDDRPRDAQDSPAGRLPPAEELDREYWRPRTAGEVAWHKVGVGSALGIGLLPYVGVAITLGVIVPITGLAALIGADEEVMEVLAIAIYSGCGLALAAMAACFLTCVASIVVLPFVALGYALLGVRSRMTSLAGFAGGIVAFTLSAPVWGFVIEVDGWGPMTREWLFMAAFFPGLATPAAQYGAASVAKSIHSIRRTPPELSREVTPSVGPPAGGGVRFSVRQMLTLTMIASMLLTGMHLFGVLHPRVVAVITAWGGYQLGSLRLVTWLLDRSHRKQVTLLRASEQDGQTPEPAACST